MTHPIVYARNPDEVLYDADLGDTAWEAKAGINVLSDQATFDIPVEGETANGLRISLGRGTFTVEHANEVQVVTAVDTTLAAATAAYVEATLTLTITHSSGIQAFAAVKTAVDAITGINSSYYGNATGADIASETSGMFAGARTFWGYVRVTVVSDMLIKIATTTPANADDDTSRLAIEEQVWDAVIPPDHRFYCKRRVATDVIGCVEMWRMTVGEYRKYAG